MCAVDEQNGRIRLQGLHAGCLCKMRLGYDGRSLAIMKLGSSNGLLDSLVTDIALVPLGLDGNPRPCPRRGAQYIDSEVSCMRCIVDTKPMTSKYIGDP